MPHTTDAMQLIEIFLAYANFFQMLQDEQHQLLRSHAFTRINWLLLFDLWSIQGSILYLAEEFLLGEDLRQFHLAMELDAEELHSLKVLAGT